MKSQRYTWFHLAVLLLALSACSKREGEQYLPALRDGDRKDYSLQLATPQTGVQDGAMTMRIDGTVTINGKTYFKEVTVTSGIPGIDPTIRYLRQDDHGIHAIDADDSKQTEYVYLPIPLKVGSSWTYESQKLKWTFTAETVETLELFDRAYKDCLKVSFSLSEGGEGFFYLAPGIGDVKGVIKGNGVTVEYLLKTK